MEKRKKNDWILIVGVLIIAIIAWGVMVYGQEKNTKDGMAVVMVDGEEYGQYALGQDSSVQIELPDGSYNILELKNGQADMTDASCPDKVCVEHREISKKEESIVCLPNKVIVTIKNGAEAEVDSLTN